MRAFESIQQLDLGGDRLSLGPHEHQASDFVDLTFLGAQRWGDLTLPGSDGSGLILKPLSPPGRARSS